MSASRERLPNRRFSEAVSFELNGIQYRAQLSRFADGRCAEIFIDGPKAGSAASIAVHDAGIAASLAFQCGAPVETLQHALLKLENEEPASPLGRALQLLLEDSATA